MRSASILVRPTPFAVFVWLWVLGIVLHMSDRLLQPISVEGMIVLLFALLFCLLPEVHWFIVLLSIQVLHALWVMPVLENHWLLVMVVNLVLLSTLGQAYLRGRSVDDGSFDRAVPILKILAVLTYFLAFLHKINRDFFDPEVSCAVHFFGIARETFLLPLPNLPGPLVIWIVLTMEIAIPLLLLHRRTWLIGIVIGVLFHLLALPAMRDFPQFMFALYLLFIPRQIIASFIGRVRLYVHAITGGRMRLFVVFRFYVFCVFGLSLAGVFVSFDARKMLQNFSIHLWVIVVLLLSGALVLFVLRSRALLASRGNALKIKRTWLLLFPLLFILNSFQPYFGLKTTAVLTMFSNLRTEAGETNHLFLPRLKLPGISYQEDLVEILATNIPELRKYGESGRLLTWHTLRRGIRILSLDGRQNLFIHYRRGGREERIVNAERDLTLTKEESLLERKFLEFRVVQSGKKVNCVW